MSSASWSGVSLAKAFFDPSGLCDHVSTTFGHTIQQSLRLVENGVIPDEGVDLYTVHIVQGLESLLDLPLVCLDIADEDERVVLLDLLHGALRV
jgi:hypothetical protein